MNKLGFMQGRLSPIVDDKIQAFPFKYWEEEFSLANKLGITCMEWTLDYPNLRSNPLLNNQCLDKIKNLCEKFKISIPSVTLDCSMQRPFWKEKEKNNYKYLVEDFELILKSASLISSEVLVIPLVDNGSIKNSIEINTLKNTLKNFYSTLKSKNMKIAFESDFAPKKLAKFLDNFDPNLIGINYDIGNSASLGFDSDEEFKEYGKSIINVHVKDRLFNGETVRLGFGNADFTKIFKNLKKINYEGNLIMQTARSKVNEDYDELKINLSFLSKIIHDIY